MRGWFESTFGAGALAAIFVVALIVFIVLLAIIAAFARQRKKNAGPAKARGRQPRLAIMDMTVVDDRRKLILIRRDNVEHLVMIGGPSDLVVESGIVRNRLAPQVAERAPDRATAGLAMQAQSRAQIRTPSASAVGSEAASGDGSNKGSGKATVEARAAPPVRSTQFVNPYKLPESTREEKTPGPAATAGQASPTAAPAQSAQTASQTVSPASSPAAVAGLAAGAAALTAAAASVKRRKPSSNQETPSEKSAEAKSELPAGLNGSDGMTSPVPDAAPEAAPDAATSEPTAPESIASEDTAKGAKKPDAKTIAETATEPGATADMIYGATPPADTKAGTDTAAVAESEENAADKTPVVEPVESTDLVQTESADKTGETSANKSRGNIPSKSQSKDAAVAEPVEEAGAGDNGVGENLEALAPQQDRSGESADTSTEAAVPTPAKPVEAAPELTGATGDTPTGTTTEAATEALPAAAAGPVPAKSIEEIMAESDGRGDPGMDTSPQTDAPASPEPEAAPASGDTKAGSASKTTEPAAVPVAERAAAISPFPTIPEDVRRSVLEAARRAEGLLDAESRMADGGAKTTLGDLTERLEQALAEQASTLSGQLRSAADAKPASNPVPPDHSPPDLGQGPAASIEAWESGKLAPADPQAAGGARDAAPSPTEKPDAAPRQSQAMLEDESDSGVIDFSDRKKTSPETKPSDSLEDEMARLLGELTGGTSGR